MEEVWGNHLLLIVPVLESNPKSEGENRILTGVKWQHEAAISKIYLHKKEILKYGQLFSLLTKKEEVWK